MSDTPASYWPPALPPAFDDPQFQVSQSAADALSALHLDVTDPHRPILLSLLSALAAYQEHAIPLDRINDRNQWAFIRKHAAQSWTRIRSSLGLPAISAEQLTEPRIFPCFSAEPRFAVMADLTTELLPCTPLQLACSFFRVAHAHPAANALKLDRPLLNKTVYALLNLTQQLVTFAKLPKSKDQKKTARAARRELVPTILPGTWLEQNPEAAARAAARSKARTLQPDDTDVSAASLDPVSVCQSCGAINGAVCDDHPNCPGGPAPVKPEPPEWT